MRIAASNGNGAANGAAAAQSLALAAEAAKDRQQQLEAAQQRVAEAEAAAQRARDDAQVAQAAASKLEADLQDLSAAYGTLDAHAGNLQTQVEQLQRDLTAAAEQRHLEGGGGCGVSQAELQQRVEAARQEAQDGADDVMADLLVCLGQEEAKVARLQERLQALGVDCHALLADIVAAGD